MGKEDNIVTMYGQSLMDNHDLRQRLLQKKAEKVDIYRPNERDFSDIYSKEEIEKDLAEIDRLEKLWKETETEEERYLKEIAAILEGVIADQAEQNSWLGDNCEVFPASRCDDISNGIDAIGVFKTEEEKQYLGLEIDVTFSSNTNVLIRKLDGIKKEIRDGKIPTLKYFQDPETGEHKKLALPKVVIGSKLASTEKLVTLWGSKVPDRNKRLAEDPMQIEIILESLYQLRYYHNFASDLALQSESLVKKEQYQEIALAYGNMHNIFYDLYESKKDLAETHLEKIKDGVVYKTIQEYTGN